MDKTAIKATCRIIGLYDSDAVSNESALICADESRTHQDFAGECDINTIIQRFGIGENPITSGKWTTNVDIADAPDNYQAVMNQLNQARDEFMSLPARVRSRFDNNPHEFVEFVSNPENIEEMVRLGLAVERPVPLNTPPADPTAPPPQLPS